MGLIKAKKIESYKNAFQFVKAKKMSKKFKSLYNITVESWAKDGRDYQGKPLHDSTIFQDLLELAEKPFVYLYDSDIQEFVVVEASEMYVPPPSVKSIVELNQEITAIIEVRNTIQSEVEFLDRALSNSPSCQIGVNRNITQANGTQMSRDTRWFKKTSEVLKVVELLRDGRILALDIISKKLMDMAKTKTNGNEEKN